MLVSALRPRLIARDLTTCSPQARAAIVATLFFTLLLGVGYPLAVTGIGQLAFPGARPSGSLIRDAEGQVDRLAP